MQEKRIDVTSSGKQDAVHRIEGVDQQVRILIRRNDERNASRLDDGLVIALCERKVAFVEIAGDPDQRSFPMVRETIVQNGTIGVYIKRESCCHTLNVWCMLTNIEIYPNNFRIFV